MTQALTKYESQVAGYFVPVLATALKRCEHRARSFARQCEPPKARLDEPRTLGSLAEFSSKT